MLTKRIVVCLDCDLGIPGGRVVKGVQFQKVRYAGVPWKLAEEYYIKGVDEVVFLDITASRERRATMADVIKTTCTKVFVPLTVGGGIRSVKDAKRLFLAGADKVSVNTAAVQNPKLITQLSKAFGSQAVVLAIDAKRHNTKNRQWFECFIYGGREPTGLDAIEWAKRAENLGAGEILLTSIDQDGTKEGFDIELTRQVAQTVSIPVVASGGAGKKAHFAEVFKKGKADAALAAGIFHFQEMQIPALKQYLKNHGIPIRI